MSTQNQILWFFATYSVDFDKRTVKVTTLFVQ